MSLTVVPANNNSWQNQLFNFVSPLLSDWIKSAREAEQNRKQNAAIAKTIQDIQNLAQSQNQNISLAQPPMPDGYNSDGWQQAFHKNGSPLELFDLGTSGAAQKSTSLPTMADMINAYAANLATERFSMLNPKTAMELFSPILNANEAARIEQRNSSLAEAIKNAKDYDELSRTLFSALPHAAYDKNGIDVNAINAAEQQYRYRHPYMENWSSNDGQNTHVGYRNPVTGEIVPTGNYPMHLTPQQVQAGNQWDRQLDENRRQFEVTAQDNRDFRNREMTLREQQQDFLEKQALWAREHPEYARYTDSQGKLWGLKPGESQAVAITGPDGQQLTGEPNMYWPAQNATRTTTTSAKNNSTTNPVIELLNKDLEALEKEEQRIIETMRDTDDKTPEGKATNNQNAQRLQQIRAEKEAIRAARYRVLAPSNTPTSSREIPTVSLGSQFIGNANTGRISRNGEFGNDRGDHLHHGTDYPVREGEPIRLPDFWGDSLKVVKAHTNPNTSTFGNHVILEGNVGGQTVRFTLAHMKTGSVRVKTGQIIKPGDLIGQVGNTGRSHGAHLHLEVRVNGQRIDPEKYFQTMQPHFPAQNPNDNVNLTPFPRDNEANTTQNPQNTQNNTNQNNNTQNSNSPVLWKHKDNGRVVTEAQYQSFIRKVEAGEVEGIKNREDADNYLVREGYIRENQSQNQNPNQPNITSSANDPVVFRNPQTGREVRKSKIDEHRTKDEWPDYYIDQIYRSLGFVKVQENTTPQTQGNSGDSIARSNEQNNVDTALNGKRNNQSNNSDTELNSEVMWENPDGRTISVSEYNNRLNISGMENPDYDAWLETQGFIRKDSSQSEAPAYTDNINHTTPQDIQAQVDHLNGDDKPKKYAQQFYILPAGFSNFARI